MRQIIDGKAYDTDTGELIGEASASCPCNDFGFWEERLFRSPGGAYFLAGEGGAASSWAERYGNNESGPGEGIRVLPEVQARRWAERYLNADEYEAAFGPAEEG